MAMKMDRRSFLKTSAAVAVAVSMTGLLGGCSGGDGGTDLGGFTVAVGEWSAVPHDQGMGTGKSWYADFAVKVRVHNLDSVNGFSFPAKSVFVLKINGQKVALQGGDLLSNITLVMKKGERRTGILTFRLDESQKMLYQAMEAHTAEIKLTVGVAPTETYTAEGLLQEAWQSQAGGRQPAH